MVLAGRSEERGRRACLEVVGSSSENEVKNKNDKYAVPASSRSSVKFLQLDWKDRASLRSALEGASAVVHTAGPYLGEKPIVLEEAIAAGYVLCVCVCV